MGAIVAGVYRFASRLLQQARCLRQLPSSSCAAVERVAGRPASLGGTINQETRIFTSGFDGNRSMFRYLSMAANAEVSSVQESAGASPHMDQPQRIKFKRLDKTAKHIMNILDKEAVETVQSEREIPDIRPGYIIQLKVEVPENKRRVSTIKGIVIARRNAGLNTTFRLRRLVAGVGVESVFPLYSPNIKEVKILDKKKTRRAKLYYLRDRMNPLKK